MLTKALAYEKWMGIKAEHQPPTLYRLLAIDAFETDKEVISNAADGRMGFVRQFQAGENAKLAAEILNELARAQIILLNPQKKAAYDTQLRDVQLRTASPASSIGRNSGVLKVAAPLPGTPLTNAPVANPVAQPANVDLDNNLDVESLAADSPQTSSTASSITKPAKARNPINPLVAALAGGAIAVGVLAAIVMYIVAANRHTSQNTNANNIAKGERPKTTASPPRPKEATGDSGRTAALREKPLADPTPESDKPSTVAVLPRTRPAALPAETYSAEQLAKDMSEITELAKAVKTPYESRGVAVKAIVLADRAIVLGRADTAKMVAIISLAAARGAEATWLERRATVLLIQLQSPLSDALKEEAKSRLGEARGEDVAAASEEPEPHSDVSPHPARGGSALRPFGGSPKAADSPESHVARWGKTEAQRRKIFYDLLKAVDDYGMTPQGRKAWRAIQGRNEIDSRVTLGILNEGFGSFSDWEQPDGGGRASGRINRINWIGERTRTMSEPMLKD